MLNKKIENNKISLNIKNKNNDLYSKLFNF